MLQGRGKITHHNRHTRRLHNRRQDNQQAQNLPPRLAQPLPARQDDDVGDDAHALEHDGKAHQEPDGPPHGAEVAVLAVAVFALGKTLAGVREGGTAAVEAVGVVEGGLH